MTNNGLQQHGFDISSVLIILFILEVKVVFSAGLRHLLFLFYSDENPEC